MKQRSTLDFLTEHIRNAKDDWSITSLSTYHAIVLGDMIKKALGLKMSVINNGGCPKYKQNNARQRMLAVLYDVKQAEEKTKPEKFNFGAHHIPKSKAVIV